MLSNISNLLKKYNKKVWLMYNKESCDNIFEEHITKQLGTSTFCFISQSDVYIIVHDLDRCNVESFLKENLQDTKKNKYNIKVYTYISSNEFYERLEEIIDKLKFPKEILLSYSTMSDKSTDILSHGDYIYLNKTLKKVYNKYQKRVRFSSAEKLIYEICSKKTKPQIERLGYLARLTSNILSETFENIKIGMTEKDINLLTISIMKKILEIEKNKDKFISYDVAWEDAPIVLVGENLSKGGHTKPSNKPLKCGETIYFDFGIKVTFSDNMILYTDMQRMGYSLKKNELVAPKSVMKVFNTLVNSIDDGIENLKPGVKAYVIDEIVRKKIQDAGYPEYMHATGHPVGLNVHDIGAIISVKASKRANLELIEDGVYTLEPRIAIPNGGSIEEMVLVTKYGGKPLCNVQNKLYIVK